MLRRAALVLLPALALAPAAALASDAANDSAISALREDSSLKIRTQAAVVLGQRGAVEAVPALREAVARDDSSAVRLAAVTALARIKDRSARPTLRAAADADPDSSVRRAAARALEELGPLAVSLAEPQGAGSPEAREALRKAIALQLKGRGYALIDRGGVHLKPAVLKVDVDAKDGKTIIAVRASLVAVDDDGKMAAMLEGGARLTASGAVPEAKIQAYSAKALEAAARTLCDDLAAKLGER